MLGETRKAIDDFIHRKLRSKPRVWHALNQADASLYGDPHTMGFDVACGIVREFCDNIGNIYISDIGDICLRQNKKEQRIVCDKKIWMGIALGAISDYV
jgi:hypothetical protein